MNKINVGARHASPFKERDKTYPLVSVVTPSFNSMPFLKETIESVKIQNYPVIEHIVVDGNSSDGSKELLKEYPGLTWISEPDSGQSDALNKGFHMAKGEIIGWLNADDTYCPGAVSFAADYLLSHTDVDLIYSDVRIIDENSRIVRLSKAEPFSTEKLLVCNMVKQPAVFMRRRVLEALENVNENLHFAMDRELWLRAGLSFNLRYIPKVIFANFRFCKGTKSFESLPEFHAEWMKVLGDFQNNPDLNEKLRKKVDKALRVTMGSYHLSFMIKANNEGRHGEAVINFFKAVSRDWKVFFQRGAWKLLFKALLRIKSG